MHSLRIAPRRDSNGRAPNRNASPSRFTARRATLSWLLVSAGTLLAVACGSSNAPDPKTAGSTTDVPKPTSSASSTAQSSTAGTSPAGSSSSAASPAASASAQSLEDLGKNALGNIVGANRTKFRGCYDDIRKKKPNIGKGNFVIDFWVNADGTLKSAKYVKEGSDFEDSELETCIIAQLKTLTFPKSSLGKEHGTVYQFGFSLNK
ncbi:MAG: AgmX/PglI C-terminal domain-containing protein [Polyangiaceae bacterium]